MAIEIDGVTCTYMIHTPFEQTAVCDVTLTLAENRTIAIMGATGSGKSTLMQLGAGLIEPTAGRVVIDGSDITQLRAKKKKAALAEAMRLVGMVFQYPETQLFAATVFDDIAFAPRNMKLPEKEVTERVDEAMRFTGLDEHYKELSPLALSGGEMRRVAIAGILAKRPKYLFLDEPTAGLDIKGKNELLTRLTKYRKKSKTTIVFISHQMDDIVRYADETAVMAGGRLLAAVTPSKVFTDDALLEAAQLKPPPIREFLLKLKAAGVETDTTPLTPEAGKAAILTAIR